MEKHVLIVEDESDIASALSARLKSEGFKVTIADNGIDGQDIALEEHFDVAILDIMLPGKNGLEVAKALREQKGTAILLLSALDEEQDIISGLNIGADDYVTKPFSIREVVARVHALIRRNEQSIIDFDSTRSLSYDFGNLTIDSRRHQVILNAEEIHTTPTEFKILSTLCSKPSIVFTREDLVALLSNNSTESSDFTIHTNVRTVDSHIRSLRKKIGADFIKTIHAIGYSFEPQNSSNKVSA